MSSGQVAVLLHAFPCDGSMWSAQADALSAAGWDVLVPDLPGFGRSDLIDGAPSIDAVADTVLRQLAAQRIDRAVLGGLSLGGYVAMAMLRKAPAKFSAVLLCDTKASADGEQAIANRERLAEAVLAEPGDCGRILRESVLPGLLGATTFARRPAVVEEVTAWLDAARPATVAWYQRAMAARPESFDTLAALTVPTLVLWGEQDTLSPAADQRAMLDVLRRGTEHRVAESGHLSATECSADVSGAIVGFLESARPAFV